MNFSDNKLSITQEYEWNILSENICDNRYIISKVFNSPLDEMLEWQIVLYCHNDAIFGYLHHNNSIGKSINVHLEAFFHPIRKPGKSTNIVIKHYEDLETLNWFYIQDRSDIFMNPDLSLESVTLHFKIMVIKMLNNKYQLQNPPKTILHKIFMCNDFNDFSFVCSDEREVKANRSILSISSSAIKAMIDSPTTESKKYTLALNDIDSYTMLEAIRFMYIGMANTAGDLAAKLLYCANKYNMTELTDFCIESMISNLRPNNVIEYLLLAHQYERENHYLTKYCNMFIKCNFDAVHMQEGWKKLNPKVTSFIEDFVAYNEDNSQPSVLKISENFYRDTLPLIYKKFF